MKKHLYRWGLYHTESTVCTILRCQGHSVFLMQQHQHNRQWVIENICAYKKGSKQCNSKWLWPFYSKSKLKKVEKSKVSNTHLGKRWAWEQFYLLILSESEPGKQLNDSILFLHPTAVDVHNFVIKYPVGSKVLLQYGKAVKTGKTVRLQLLLIFVLSKHLLGIVTFATAALKTGLYLSTKDLVSRSV